MMDLSNSDLPLPSPLLLSPPPMQLSQLISLINEAESIEQFALNNLLKIATNVNLNRFILNYDDTRLRTPSGYIAHYCRGLTLQGTPKAYKIIAKSFDRFFNHGQEFEYIKNTFDSSKPFEVQHKYDGSLILQLQD